MTYQAKPIKILLLIFCLSIMVQVSSANGPIPDTHEGYPSWSPTGEKILFSSYGPNIDGMFIVNPDGSELQQKTNLGELEPSWSPDGTKIIFVKNFYNGSDERKRSYDIGTLELKSGNLTRITFIGSELKQRVPQFSPDGNYVLFEASKNSYIINSNGSDLKLIAKNSIKPKWSQDGKKIAFYSLDTNYISVANSDGSEEKQIYPSYLIQNFRWTLDSKHLLLNNGSNIVTKVNVDNPSDIEYVYDPVAHWKPTYSYDGNFIAFISDIDGGNPDLFIARSNGSDLYRIVFNTNPSAPNRPDYFGKISRLAPPPWPWFVPLPMTIVTQTISITPTATATPTPEVPGFSFIAPSAALIVLIPVIKRKR